MQGKDLIPKLLAISPPWFPALLSFTSCSLERAGPYWSSRTERRRFLQSGDLSLVEIMDILFSNGLISYWCYVSLLCYKDTAQGTKSFAIRCVWKESIINPLCHKEPAKGKTVH